MIGIFDSGVGGLSVFREIRKVLPKESYIYFSDNAHCPYGDKSREYIIDRAREITRFLLDRKADIIVVACNTATAAAISSLREEFPVKFIGMEPAIKPAASCSRTGVIGVLATAGTLRASKYIDTRDRFGNDVQIVEHVGKGFVELVESGKSSGIEAEAVVSESLAPLIEAGADTIVLGCTHYPFLSETIHKVACSLAPDRQIQIIDPAPAVARHVADVMAAEGLPGSSSEGFNIELYSSGSSSSLLRVYNSLL